ncbi:F-box protein CPR1-like isoform X2 [Rhododendron vialii]|uniref:F-box protein CPR1-like isoform X2 n=1 Tax=Rhododendron vialii TaxID=182163 RepID=UPI00265F6CFE|nr:F-box protein CPR1-like isoform X2 [Rhododendron vialii]
MEWVLPHLPHELIFNILSRLPVKSLCRFKRVSKPWLALITDPHFIKSHLNHQSTKDNKTQKLILAVEWTRFSPRVYSVDYQAPDPTVFELELPNRRPVVKILGSLYGILLILTGKYLRLWNPSIKMFRKFSPPMEPEGDELYGLGYDSVSDDFKVVTVFPFGYADGAKKSLAIDSPSVVHVFSSKLSSWKSIGFFDYCIGHDPSDRSGIAVNGAPHWIANRLGLGMGYVIVYFDATEEKFKEVPSPCCEGEDMRDDERVHHLGVLGGWLCMVTYHRTNHADVWVMKKYGVKESWTKLFVLPNEPGKFMPLCYASDGEVVMVLDLEKLVSYDLKECSYKTIDIALYEPYHMTFDVALYVENLYSPHDGMGHPDQMWKLEKEVSNLNLGESST